jgi:hypothetical protein
MRIAVTGATGLVGKELKNSLAGYDLLSLVRRPTNADEVLWSVETGVARPELLEACEAVVHLAGENIADGRWTAGKKERIRHSRVAGTESLCRSLAQLKTPPKVLVSASAIGYYGNRGDEVLTEVSQPGQGFFPSVCVEWEAATGPLEAKGVRVVHLRIGVVLSKKGGALGKMLLPFKLGLGGRLGSGAQFMSWIALDDLVEAIKHVIEHEEISGPVNATAPNPVTNAEFARALARALGRPAMFPVPEFALRLAVGEMADEALLAGSRVMPAQLLSSGFVFRFPDLAAALEHTLR